MTQLGSAFAPSVVSDPMGGFLEGLITQVVREVMASQKQPIHNFDVSAPNVKVAPADVHFDPQITIQEREIEPVINITCPGMDDLALAVEENNRLLAQMTTALQSVVTLLQKPVLKVVERGKGGLISEVRETRG